MKRAALLERHPRRTKERPREPVDDLAGLSNLSTAHGGDGLQRADRPDGVDVAVDCSARPLIAFVTNVDCLRPRTG